ncbi:hypothetical protein CL653_00745 [bacterium]|nr:hypothetical protein [bacterium]
MFNYIWHTFFFDPVYNSLVFFIDVIPGADVGLAIIATTILVKTILLPISIKAAKTQVVMRELDPKLKEIKEKFKDSKEEQAKEMMALYKDSGLNPFASVFLVLLQIPIIIALYLAVMRGGGVPLPDINIDILYSFVASPESVNMIFLGMIDITTKSLPLALMAGIAQFYQAKLITPKMEPREKGAAPDFKADFQRSMQIQMRFVLPVIIFVVAYTISAAIAIYFTIGALTSIAQELYVKKHR